MVYVLQTISYMAERVVGTGSFGIVFQVFILTFWSNFAAPPLTLSFLRIERH